MLAEQVVQLVAAWCRLGDLPNASRTAPAPASAGNGNTYAQSLCTPGRPSQPASTSQQTGRSRARRFMWVVAWPIACGDSVGQCRSWI